MLFEEMKSMVTVELLCFGNELLIGKVVNTNASFLAKEITNAGVDVSRIVTLGDSLNDLVNGFKESLARSPDFLITSGGLGPTFDDRTLEGLACALEVPLEENPEALKMVEKAYSFLDQGLNPARQKMARLPRSAQPLPNSVGTAPSIRLKYQISKTVIFCLPGVPAELQAIFKQSILPEISKKGKKFFQASFRCSGVGESSLAHLTEQLLSQYPRIYIKSHPKMTEKEPVIEFHLTAKGNNPGLAIEIEQVKQELINGLKELSAKIKSG